MGAAVVMLTILALGLPSWPSLAADVPGSAAAADALRLCHASVREQGGARMALLVQGLALAESALAADERDARAHFAVFCNLGRKVQNEGLRFSHLAAARRLRREIDRTLALAPEAPDPLVAKAEFLLALPRFFGGDPREAERLARRAVTLAPDLVVARVTLARTLAARGARAEAREELRRALLAPGADLESGEARTLLTALGG